MVWTREMKMLAVGAAVSVVLAVVSVCFLIKVVREREKEGKCLGEIETIWQVEREVFVDTIPFYKPVARDSVVTRYETVYIPVERKSAEQSVVGEELRDTVWADRVTVDTIEVTLPITQKVYEEREYRAYVSGYAAELDSIFVYPRTEVVMQTQTQTVTLKERPKRWGIGVQGGYGYGPKGFQPYVGIGVSYDIIRF